jgi:hypothetical protein
MAKRYQLDQHGIMLWNVIKFVREAGNNRNGAENAAEKRCASMARPWLPQSDRHR